MKKTLLLVAVLFFVVLSYAQKGKPDLAFGDGGAVTYPIENKPGTVNFAQLMNTAFQADGKIVSVGVTTEKGKPNFLITRYNTDGTPDKSFNGTGSIVPDFSRGNESAQDVVVQGDGKIVVAGQGYLNGFLWLIVARYNTDGSVDNSFNGTGNIITDGNLTGTGGYHYMVLQSDGKIVVSGQRSARRFNTNGTQDNTFAGSALMGTVNTIVLQSDDKILAAGFANGNFILGRYKRNGGLDSTFGQNGVTITDMGDNDEARAIAIQPDGKIMVSGTSYNYTPRNLQYSLARYLPNGSLDNSFSGDGKNTIDLGTGYGTFSSSYPTGLAIQDNGKIIVGGPGALAIFNNDGTLDNTYPWKGGNFNQYSAQKFFIRNNRLYTSSYKIYAYLLEDGLSSGLYYKYYEGTWTTLPNFNEFLPAVKSGNSANVDINVRTAGRNDNFAFIWRGYIKIPAAGSYTFETVSDDGSKVYFNADYGADSIALVNNDGVHPATSATGTVNIATPGVYPISFTYFENSGGEAMQVYWTGPGITRQLIPNSAFMAGSTPEPPTGGLSYKYYEVSLDFLNLQDFNTFTPAKTGTSANVDISVRNPGRDDHFAFVWEGNINIPAPGNYTFTIISDDGSKLFFNSLYDPKGIPLINNDGAHAPRPASGTLNIPTAGSYPLAITYFEKDGGESMQVYWSGPGIPMQLIPNSAFSKANTPVIGGLNYKYYEGSFSTLPNFNALTPVKTGNSPNVDISLRTAGRNDNFAFLWEGNIKIPTPGLYTFETVSDDGSKLYFNTSYSTAAIPTVDNDGLHAAASATGAVNIAAAGVYPISITFFEKDGGENMQVYWSGPGIERQLIPSAAFTQSSPPNGLNYKYYEGSWNTLPDFTALTPTKTGYASNLDLNLRTPGRNDQFAFLWEGYITAPISGNFTFELVSDDGSKFYFNQPYSPSAIPLINNDGLHAATSVPGYVTIGRSYPIALTYFEKDGGETLQLYWSAPGLPRQLVPASAFSLSSISEVSNLAKEITTSSALADEAGKSNITRIYPNPFAERFTVSFYNNKASDDISVAIYDLNGRKLHEQHPGQLAQGNATVVMNLRNKQLNNGVYLVAVSVNGVRSKAVKLIKQK